MSDDEKKQRPNANYKLSYENVKPEEIVYHYSRERRLANAPQSVRDLYNAEPHRFNLLKPLVRTKPLAMMFTSIVVAVVLITLVSVLGLANSHDLDGNRISVQAIQYEGAIIVAVDKSARKTGLARFSRSQPYTGAVEIAVQPALQTDESIFYHKIFFTLEPEEKYRFSVPFDAESLALVFKTETKTLGLTVKAE